MKLAVMQPYFFPYIGYYQLLAAVDRFVVYDNIKYTKKGWINRNRMLQNGKEKLFSLPLKRDLDSRNVCERELAADSSRDRLLNQIQNAYRRAPYFASAYPLVERIVRHEEANLFGYLHNSLVKTCEHLGIATEVSISSGIPIDHGLKNQDKVLALCAEVGARTYVNAIGGRDLYSRETFRERGIELKFIQSRPFEYAQFGAAFVPWLSIIDVMMFNSEEKTRAGITGNYDLI